MCNDTEKYNSSLVDKSISRPRNDTDGRTGTERLKNRHENWTPYAQAWRGSRNVSARKTQTT